MQPTATQPEVGLELAPGLMRLAWRLAGADEADDLVQATYLRALEHDGPVREPRSWLRRVLLNERWMELRGRRRRDDRERAAGAPDDAADVEHVIHCLEVARLVDRLIDELDEDVRLVVRERYFEGHSSAEIARRHSIPAGTVRWRLKSGLDRLRRELDAHHGGRRMLWAGGFAPLATSPTQWLAAASRPATAHVTTTAAAKGSSIMTIQLKLLLGAGILAVGGATAASMGTREGTEPVAESVATASIATPDVIATADATPPQPGPTLVAATAASSDTAPSVSQAAWAKRRSLIQAALGAAPSNSGFTWTQLDGGEVEIPEGDAEFHGASACADPGCVERLTTEVANMVEGCRELMDDVPLTASIEAEIIGAPGVGTIVESVALTGGASMPDELRECLTQSMYTLDLGATEQDFSQSVTLLLGGSARQALAQIRGTELDDDTRAAVEAAIAAADEPGREGPRMLFMSEGEPTPGE